jgi:hypothetical protein
MPTVGWIRDKDWEVFLEATEPVVNCGPPVPPSYRCPFCNTVLPSIAGGSHPQERICELDYEIGGISDPNELPYVVGLVRQSLERQLGSEEGG